MRLTVIIPFYNLARYVNDCLASVRAACLRIEPEAEVEVICVDDGSTDSTPGLLDAGAILADEIPGFSFRVLHKENGGEGSARNAGLDAATGEWVTFLDGDDVWLPNLLEEAIPLLNGNPAADVINLRFAPFEDGAASPEACAGSAASVIDVRTEVPDEVLLGVGVYPTFFRREMFGGMRFSALPLGADRLYVAHVLAHAKTVVMSDAVVHGYRVRAGSMARATWTVRKVNSQCDYAAGALTALAESGKRIGRGGVSYLASLWLSDVPAHVRRLPLRADRREAARHWIASWGTPAARLLFGRRRFVMGALKRFSGFSSAAVEAAHAFRILGVI